jgi:arsenite methyltransferase
VTDTDRADYGFDAPYAAIGLGAAALAFLVWAVLAAVYASGGWWLLPLAYAVFFGLRTASFVYTTRRGKFRVWRELLAALGLAGTERVVDLGCGRGAVLILAAHRLSRHCPLGVDAAELTRLGLTDVRVRGLGWRFWYGGPWGSSSLVTAVR